MDQIALDATRIILCDQVMPGLCAKMRYVHDRCGIIGQNLQYLTAFKGRQTFARFQNGQGAKQPDGIKFGIMFHNFPIRRDVSACKQLRDGQVTSPV